MGLFTRSRQEDMLAVDFFQEMANLWGVNAKLFQIDSINPYLLEHQIVYKDPVELLVVLDEHPKIKTLEALGWFSEDDEILPLIAYLPVLCPLPGGERAELDVREHVKLEVGYRMKEKRGALFLISKINASSLANHFWTCKLTPYREAFVPPIPPPPASGFKFIDADRKQR